MSRGEGDFPGRWSSRKLKARDAERLEPAPAETESAAPPALSPDLSGKTDEEILQELGLPDPDTLWKGDDFSVFLKGAVPARLRNRALRRLWRSNPVLANLDGLNDYDGDFTDAATVVKGGVRTAYKVGRGLLRDEPEPTAAATDARQASAEAAAEESADEAAEESADETSQGAPDQDSPEPEPGQPGPAAPPEERVAVADAAGAQRETEAAPRAPRMRFRFEG